MSYGVSSKLSLSHFLDRLPYIDQIRTGFIALGDSVKGYVTPEEHGSPIVWESASQHLFSEVASSLSQPEYFSSLTALWSQETSQKAGATSDLSLRSENSIWIKIIGKSKYKMSDWYML